MPAKNTKRRLRLFAEYPYCHWCKARVYEDVKQTAANRATLDHVEDRVQRGGKRTTLVLACYSCNKNRNVAHTKARAGKRITSYMEPFLKTGAA